MYMMMRAPWIQPASGSQVILMGLCLMVNGNSGNSGPKKGRPTLKRNERSAKLKRFSTYKYSMYTLIMRIRSLWPEPLYIY